MQRHNCNLKIKAVNETGAFQGIGACYNSVDLGGDQILPGAFARTLAASKTFPLLWQHQPDNPNGTATVTDSPAGLIVNGQLLMDLDDAKRAYILIKARVIKGLSIGFDTIQESVEDGVRQLKEVRLWEFSIVTFPMSTDAAISSVKNLSADELKSHLEGVRRAERGIQVHTKSLRMHTKAIFGDDLDDDDPAYDSTLLEGSEDDDSEDEEMSKVFLIELQELAEEAQQLASV